MGSLDKPPVGAPCNGCGLCCRAQICSLGSITLGLVGNYGERAPGPCPALIGQPDGSFACGLVLRPRDYARGKGGAHELRAAAMTLIGAGVGCDEPGEAESEEENAAIEAMTAAYLARVGHARIERAMRTWFGL